MRVIRFTVSGLAQPKGSTRLAIRNRAPRVVPDNAKAKDWQHAIGWSAREAIATPGTITGPVAISIWFYLPRPMHQTPVRIRPTTKPDLDKLVRCACDALTGVIYRDDCQVVNVNAWKYYGAPPRAEFVIREVSNGQDENMRPSMP